MSKKIRLLKYEIKELFRNFNTTLGKSLVIINKDNRKKKIDQFLFPAKMMDYLFLKGELNSY